MSKKQPYKKKRVQGQMRALTREQVAAIATILRGRGEWRNLAMFRGGIDSMLRASDLCRILVEEIVDHRGEIASQARIMMKKTGETVDIQIGEETREALALWLKVSGGGWRSKWLFPGRPKGAEGGGITDEHITEVRYRQLVKEWFDLISLDLRFYSTHSIRRTKATAIYADTHNLKAVSELLGHRDTKMTERYIGVSRKEALDLAAKVKI